MQAQGIERTEPRLQAEELGRGPGPTRVIDAMGIVGIIDAEVDLFGLRLGHRQLNRA
jgi:hypothetical protein